jgi:hypothetical protein
MLPKLQRHCIIQMLFQNVKTADKSLQRLRPSIFTEANKVIIQWISASPALGTGHPGTAVGVKSYRLRTQGSSFLRRLASMKQGSKKWSDERDKYQRSDITITKRDRKSSFHTVACLHVQRVICLQAGKYLCVCLGESCVWRHCASTIRHTELHRSYSGMKT